MLFMFQYKDKDLIGIYQYGCDPFCVSLLTDRDLQVRAIGLCKMFSRWIFTHFHHPEIETNIITNMNDIRDQRRRLTC